MIKIPDPWDGQGRSTIDREVHDRLGTICLWALEAQACLATQEEALEAIEGLVRRCREIRAGEAS